MDETKHTRLLEEVTEFLKSESTKILDGWAELMRPVVGDTLHGLNARPRAERFMKIIADLLDGEPYESYSNYIRRIFLDLSGAGYGPSWILDTLDLFIEYLSAETARWMSNRSDYGPDAGVDEIRDALNDFLNGSVGFQALRDLALIAESISDEKDSQGDEVRRERELMLRITGTLHSAMSKREIFSNLLPVLTELIPAAQASAIILFDDAAVPRLTDVYNLGDFQPVKSEVNLERSIYHDILLTGEDRVLDRSRLSENIDFIFRRATTVGKKVLRAQPLSVAVIPIHSEKRPVGGIALFNYDRESSFGEAGLSLLKVITRQLTLALERVRYSERAKRQHLRIQTVLEMADAIKYNQPPREVAEAILGIVRRSIDFTRGFIFSISDGGDLLPIGAIDIEAPLDARSLNAPERPQQLLVLPIQRQEIIHLEDLSDIAPFAPDDLPAPIKGVNHGSLIIAPMAIDKEPVGLMLMYHRDPHSFDDEEIDLIKVLCQQGAHFIMRSIEYERYIREKSAKDNELELSQRMQMSLFPNSFRSGKWEVQAALLQADRLAGDFAIIEPVKNGLAAAVGDICGRGQPAGMVMMRVYGLVKDAVTQHDDPGDALGEVNSIVCRQFEGTHKRSISDAFVNCVLAFAGTGGRLQLAGAGTPPVLLYHGSTGEVFVPDVTGIPLGVKPDTPYSSSNLKLSPGDKLLLYSDGLVTGHDVSGHSFGVERLRDLFARFGRFPSRVILDLITGSLKDETDRDNRTDDRTALIIAANDSKLKRISFKGEDAEREEACEMALGAVRRRSTDRDLLFAVRLALHEIVKNAIEHGNRGDKSLDVHLTYLAGEDFVHLAVRDSGAGFDPGLLKSGLGSAEILRDKGRGFLMVKQLMDRVWFDPSAGEINLFTRFSIPEAKV